MLFLTISFLCLLVIMSLLFSVSSFSLSILLLTLVLLPLFSLFSFLSFLQNKQERKSELIENFAPNLWESKKTFYTFLSHKSLEGSFIFICLQCTIGQFQCKFIFHLFWPKRFPVWMNTTMETKFKLDILWFSTLFQMVYYSKLWVAIKAKQQDLFKQVSGLRKWPLKLDTKLNIEI